MLNFFHIPVKLISRQVHIWSLVQMPFDIEIALQRQIYLILNQLVLLANHFLIGSHLLNDCLYYIMGCAFYQ